MKRFLLFGFVVLAGLFPAFAAAQPELSGIVLINTLEIGAAQNPNRLFAADLASGKITELLVENGSIFAPWFGWSPDGRKFAYLAPARRGINFELWLADANINNPNPRPPLFEVGLTPVQAAWNPVFNVIAVGTVSRDGRDGLYLVNTNTENIVFLREEPLRQHMILDWSSDGSRLAYSSDQSEVSIINPDGRATILLQNNVLPNPAPLGGWTGDNSHFVFSNDSYQFIYAISTDGGSELFSFDPAFVIDPYSLRLIPGTNRLLALYDRTLMITDVASGELQITELNTQAAIEPDYAVAWDGTLVLNSFVTREEGIFAECLLLEPGSDTPQPIRDLLQIPSWTHTRCRLLNGATHIAVMATNAVEDYENLPEVWLYDLYVTPTSLEGGATITHEFPGFEITSVGFSPSREQVIFREGDALVVYDMHGSRVALANLSELNLNSDLINFQFAWQP